MTRALVLALTTWLAMSGVGPAQHVAAVDESLPPPSADASLYFVAKGRAFLQPPVGVPVPATNGLTYVFMSGVKMESSGSITGATVRAPSGALSILTENEDWFRFGQSFSNKALLNAAFSNGHYSFKIKTVHDGSPRPALPLPPDAYPSTPVVLNLADAQSIDASADFMLFWDPFKKGTSDDLVSLRIESASGDDLFSTPGLLESEALTGTNTSAIIPANALQPGETYVGRLLFARRTWLDTTNYPGVPGVTFYSKETRFTLATTTNAPAEGRFLLSASTYSVIETQREVTVTVIRAGGSTGPTSVRVSTQDSTATAGADYTAFSRVLDFLGGEDRRSFTIPILDDWALEGTESFRMMLTEPSGGAVIGTPSNAVVRILDSENAQAGTLSFKKATTTIFENAGVVRVNVIRSGTNGLVTVTASTHDGGATAGEDYTAVTTNLVFAPGVVKAVLVVPLIDDTVVETNEGIWLSLTEPTGGATINLNPSELVWIISDDYGGIVQFAQTNFVVSEAGRYPEITVIRDGLAGGCSVDFFTSDLTASNAVDYLATTQPLFFDAGVTSIVVRAPIILSNGVPDGNRLVGLHLGNPSGGVVLGGTIDATLTIADDEVGVQFRRVAVTNIESAAFVLLQVERTGPTNDSVAVDYFTQDVSAAAGLDYSNRTGQLTFLPGVKKQWIEVPLINDTIVEGTETFQVVLTNVTGPNALLGSRPVADVTITDDDQAGVVAFTAKTYAVAEGAKWAFVTVGRSNGLASGVTVAYTTLTNGTAVPDTDFVPTNGTVSFGAGQLVATFRVRVLDNFGLNSSKTVGLRLSDPQGGATLGKPANAILTVLDDDVDLQGLYQPVTVSLTSGCGGQQTIRGKMVLTNQVGNQFEGRGLFFNGGTNGITVNHFVGTRGPAGAISGVFTNTPSGDYGTFTGSIVNGQMQTTISGQNESGSCPFDGTMAGGLYSPVASGFAPASLAGRSVQVTVTDEGSFRLDFSATADTYAQYTQPANLLDSFGAYVYSKTAPNTALLLISDDEGGNIFVTLTFTASTRGTFVATNSDESTSTGTFTLTTL